MRLTTACTGCAISRHFIFSHPCAPVMPSVRRGRPRAAEGGRAGLPRRPQRSADRHANPHRQRYAMVARRSEEHTSELQSPCNLVCRLLLEKKKKIDGKVTKAMLSA